MFSFPAHVISHIALRVTKLERSTRFYKDVIGLPALEEPFKIGKHSWFALGPHCQLHLIAGAPAVPAMHIDHHLALSTTNFDQFIESLASAGVDYCDAFQNKGTVHIRPDGIRQVFFQDPDGYWLEVNNDPSATQNNQP